MFPERGSGLVIVGRVDSIIAKPKVLSRNKAVARIGIFLTDETQLVIVFRHQVR
jgi:hypothetical protein